MAISRNMRIYPKREHDLERQEQRLEDADMLAVNKEMIVLWKAHLKAQHNQDHTIAKKLQKIKDMAVKLDISFLELTQDTATKLISQFNTICDYDRVFKEFCVWLEDRDERHFSDELKVRMQAQQFYKYVAKIKVKTKRLKVTENHVITDVMCNKLVEACNHLRDRAFIKLLHETGARAGEILGIKLGDIEIKENSAEIQVDGKTGPRPIPIAQSVPLLTQYMNLHPMKNNKDAYLWLSISTRNQNEPLLHAAAKQLVYRAFEAAGIEGIPRNLHWFRHSRASILAEYLTEPMLCTFMGWKVGSRQVSNYCHTSKEQLDRQILALNQVQAEEKKPVYAEPIKCGCGTLNEGGARYCFKCGKALALQNYLVDKAKFDSEMDKTAKLLMEIASNPELLKRFEAYKNRQVV